MSYVFLAIYNIQEDRQFDKISYNYALDSMIEICF